MRWRIALITVLLFTCHGCRQRQPTQPLSPVMIHVQAGQMLVVNSQSGLLKITCDPNMTRVEISGLTYPGDKIAYHLTETADRIDLSFQAKDANEMLSVHIPAVMPVHIKTFSTAISLQDCQGEVNVFSEAGDIVATGLAGQGTLRSGRGDVTLAHSRGVFNVLGEHGILTLDHSAGQLSSSTIMGTIRYSGKMAAGDAVKLEADHGPVEILLQDGSDVAIEATTTSGKAICPATQFQVNNGCRGQIGHGLGSLSVRTVSGKVWFKRAPIE